EGMPFATTGAEPTVLPLISHSLIVPLALSYQRMSDLPSPLKSPVPMIDQLEAMVPMSGEAVMVPPFICHSSIVPSVLRKRISVLPSPLKSPVPIGVQLEGMPFATTGAEPTVLPLISHSLIVPLALSYQRMSDLPSPLQSG